ncbi:phosphatidate cytidylyltransferase [Oceanospirillum multiglobuliferum]|uniref:Phosphatidate cytidylyltransferase n=1 Tax=Oceanospirillum multiglobuliferum TaxID=64969 RepID=A0A1T4RTN7_9GAMM|nr:phosphatidate cytidylyltransferase [Oceanospirillum multiglobuliferum]OPX54642.1 hypothetical protein BTE48_13295 [Oceanospirillum multiglobuliferum]SKA19345.1 phosphatidate cytidylyltransferase [Oceanospirillum multiglobuliferum]
MLKQRVITALILAPLTLWGLFGLSAEHFIWFISAVVLIASWEWADLSGSSTLGRVLYPAAMGLMLYGLEQVRTPELDLNILIFAALGWAAALYAVSCYPKTPFWSSTSARLLMGLAVLIPCWVGFVELRTSFWLGKDELLYVLLLVWTADVGAYFFGRRYGNKKLAPKVSPGKSWAGVYGGLFATSVLALFASLYWQLSVLNTLTLILITLVVTAVSVLGDLLESMVKRHRGLKDSSHLLPGHGGVMDRIDSLTAAAPIFVLSLKLTGLTL